MRRAQTLFWIILVAFLMPVLPGDSRAAENSQDAAGGKEVMRGKIELKRQATDRGTPGESSKTQLKIDAHLEGLVSLLRLELPFPDEKTDFEGDPFNPRLGDILVRVGFRPVHVRDIPVSSFMEVTFPTADPEELGSGKYQLTPGIYATVSIPLAESMAQSHSLIFSPLVKQVVSVAGDEDRKNINYTKVELALRDTWRNLFWLKLTPKPVIDWEQDAKTGAVARTRVRLDCQPSLEHVADARDKTVGRGRAQHIRHSGRTRGGISVLTDRLDLFDED